MLRQWEAGTRLSENCVLRTFPIWHDRTFHGSTNSQLSMTLAVAATSHLRADGDGQQLVAKQLQWVLGGNPFCQSLMYGEGYDYPPLFAYCLKNVVGALPVGVDSLSNDAPYWPNSNYATFKEIWTAPTERFLWIMAYNDLPAADASKAGVRLTAQVGDVNEADGTAVVQLTVEGTGSHAIQYRVFNGSIADPVSKIDLKENEPANLTMTLKIADRTKPWVVVVTADDDWNTRQEVFGALTP